MNVINVLTFQLILVSATFFFARGMYSLYQEMDEVKNFRPEFKIELIDEFSLWKLLSFSFLFLGPQNRTSFN